MKLGLGNREEWEFEYPSSQVLQGATQQKEFRLSRVQWWKEAKKKLWLRLEKVVLRLMRV